MISPCVVFTIHLNMIYCLHMSEAVAKRLRPLFVMAQQAPEAKLCQHNDPLLHTNPFKVLQLKVGKLEWFLSG